MFGRTVPGFSCPIKAGACQGPAKLLTCLPGVLGQMQTNLQEREFTNVCMYVHTYVYLFAICLCVYMYVCICICIAIPPHLGTQLCLRARVCVITQQNAAFE